MYRVDTVTTGLGGAPFLTQHFFNESVGTASQAVDAVLEFWNQLDAQIVNECTMAVQDVVYLVDQNTGLITGTTAVANADSVVGLNVAAPAALATQGLIQWRTGDYVDGREIRGRTFIPGVPQSALLDGRPTTTYMGVLDTAAASLIADSATLFYIFSRTKLTASGVVSGAGWSEFAVLRSRRD